LENEWEYFKDFESVLGFELINEPFAGNVFDYPLLFIPWRADEINLQPFYDATVKEIRKVNQNHLVFFEPVTWSDLKVHSETTGFDHAPGGEKEAGRSVFSFHYYNPPNYGVQQEYLDRRLEAALSLGVGSFLTEFGTGHDANLNDVKESLKYFRDRKISWIGWEYKNFLQNINSTCTGCGGIFFKNGTVDTHLVSALSETFAEAVAGRVISSSYEQDTKEYRISFYANPSIKKPTLIYLNEKLHYPGGFECLVFPRNDVRWLKTSPNRIEVHFTNNIEKNQLIEVYIAQI